MTMTPPAHERLRKAESALRKSQERHRLALLAGGLGSWELDLTTMELESSDSCKANFGLAPDDALPYSRLLELILPEDRPAMQGSVANAVETGADYQADYRVQWPDGSIHWIAAYGRPFFAADGTPERMLGTTQDITDRKRAEDEREMLLEEARQARAEAEQAVTMRDEFLSSALHDLRTPLTTMQGRTQLLQRRATQLGLAAQDYQRLMGSLEQVEAAVGQMRSIMDELQDVAFLQIGRPLELNQEPVDLVSLIHSAVGQLQPQSPEHRLHVESRLSALVVTVDGGRIRRVIDNLLSNAIKYSPGGGDVTIVVDHDTGWAVLQVQDYGVGIPERERAVIFEPYRRGTNVTRGFQGTGIGLSGSKQIVEQHGGSLSVVSQEGEGSTFTVRLPL